LVRKEETKGNIKMETGDEEKQQQRCLLSDRLPLSHVVRQILKLGRMAAL
jgi:hypothetical protein